MSRPVIFEVKAETQDASKKLSEFLKNAERQAKQTESAVNGTGQGVDSMGKGVEALGPRLAGFAKGGLLVVAALSALTLKIYNTVDALARLSQRVGLTVTEFSAFSKVFDTAGVSAETLSDHLLSLGQRAAQADPIFRQLGISVFRQNGAWKSAEELLLEVADRFKEMPDGIEKTNLAMRLFGSSWDLMLKPLNLGSKGLREAADAAKSTGGAISESLALQVEKLGGRFESLRNKLSAAKEDTESMARSIANDLLVAINWLGDALFGVQEKFKGVDNSMKTHIETLDKVKVAYKETIRGLGLGGLIQTETLFTPFTKLSGLREAVEGTPRGSKTERPATLSKDEAFKFELSNAASRGRQYQADPQNGATEKLLNQIYNAESVLKILGPQIEKLKASQGESILSDESGDNYYERYARVTEELNPLLEQQQATIKSISDARDKLAEMAAEDAEKARQREDDEIARLEKLLGLYEEVLKADIAAENEDIEAQVYADSKKFGNRAAKQAGQYVKDWTDGDAAIATAINTIDTALSGLSEAITGLITGTATWADVWRQTVTSVIAGIIQLMVKFLALFAITKLLGFLFPGSSFIQTFTGFAGFAEGGYTGDGGKYEPAGMVHKGEVVWSRDDIRRNGGVERVMALRRGIPTPRLSTPTSPSLDGYGGRGGGGSSRTMMIHPVVDIEAARRKVMQHPEMQHYIVDVVGGAGFVQA